MQGALHGQFRENFEHNTLVQPDRIIVLGTPLQLEQIKGPQLRHRCRHRPPHTVEGGFYRTTQLLSGDSTFLLSYSGHIVSLVNLPDNPRAHYWTGATPGSDPEEWLAGVTQRQCSCWGAWVAWIDARSGAPQQLGSATFPELDPAPGRFVRDLPPP